MDNLAIACRACNQAKGNMTAEEYGHPDVQKQALKTLKDCAIVNATRWKIYETLISTGLPVECGTGAMTKLNRTNLELPKTHYYDACSIGSSTPNKLYFKTKNVLYIKARGRGTRCRTNLDRFGFPRGYLPGQKFFFCFQTGDMVKAIIPRGKYKGACHGEVACRKSGYFDIKNNGQKVAQGISYKYFAVVQRFEGYSYRKEECGGSRDITTIEAVIGKNMQDIAHLKAAK